MKHFSNFREIQVDIEKDHKTIEFSVSLAGERPWVILVFKHFEPSDLFVSFAFTQGFCEFPVRVFYLFIWSFPIPKNSVNSPFRAIGTVVVKQILQL